MWFQKSKRIYLDHASAQPVRDEAQRAMRVAAQFVGNPGAIHAEAVAAQRSLEGSREIIAAELACKAREVVFTSGLTESNNLAIVGHARALERIKRTLTGTHWIVSAIEHPSVLECFSEVERLGGTVEHLQPDAHGIFSPETVARALKPETVFVSIGWANHEIGSVQPLSAISCVIREYENAHGNTILIQSDAGQAPLYRAPQVHTLGVDLFSIGSNKLYGPHGIGALYLSNRSRIAGIMTGGSQERGLRAGTENVELAAGFAAALHAAAQERDSEAARLLNLKRSLEEHIQAAIPDAITNGDQKRSLPHLLNVSIPDIDCEYIALALDKAGIAVSTKSACNEGESFSHVVRAITPEKWRAESTLRFSMGRDTVSADIGYTVEILARETGLFRKRKVIQS